MPTKCCRSATSWTMSWDFDFDGDPNIVEVYVRRLRTKLQRPDDGARIQTVRGAGYRLVATCD